MDENQLTTVKRYEIVKPLIHKINSLIDNCFRDCHNKYYHTFEYKCEFDIQLTNIRINEMSKITLSDRNMSLFELKKKCQWLDKMVLYLFKYIK